MEQKKNIPINLYRALYLWFKPLKGIDDGEFNTSFNFCWDYEQLPDNKWHLHLDAGLLFSTVASIKCRSSFELTCTENELMTQGILNPMSKAALENCVRAFKEQCAAHNIKFNAGITIADTTINSFTNTIYTQHLRRKEDKNDPVMKQHGFSISNGTNTNITIKATIIIIDEILFLNENFDWAHNRKVVLEDKLMEPLYYTLKLKLMEIDKGKVDLDWQNTVWFFICLDLALQMLLGDHSDTLQPALIEKGVTPELQQLFIKTGSDMYSVLNKTLSDSKATITNLEERPDWNVLIQ